MKLFLYYAGHSLLNQIKKMLRTWVVIFILACALLGGLIGVIAGKLTDDGLVSDIEIMEDAEENNRYFTDADGHTVYYRYSSDGYRVDLVVASDSEGDTYIFYIEKTPEAAAGEDRGEIRTPIPEGCFLALDGWDFFPVEPDSDLSYDFDLPAEAYIVDPLSLDEMRSLADEGFVIEDAGILPGNEDLLPGNEGLLPDDETLTGDEGNSDGLFAGLEANDIMELVAGGIILAILTLLLLNADSHGVKLFLPADAQLLFASPMKPQAVLMFRVGCTLGVYVFLSVYLLIEIPVLKDLFDLSGFAAGAMVFSWGLVLLNGVLLQVLCFTYASSHPKFKKVFRYLIYGVLGACALGFILYSKSAGGTSLQKAVGLYNAPLSRWIPIWGWIKGFLMSAVEGNMTMFAVFAALCVLGIVLLLFLISRADADFYEEALAKSEELAEAMAQAAEKGKVVLAKRDKDRSEKIRRDGLNKGSGATVLFYRNLYNRARFAKLKFFSKTSITYLAAALIAGVVCIYTGAEKTLTIIGFILSGLAFFRSLGNQLEEDVSKHYFVQIPESCFKKLFWSIAGVEAVCLLDLIPALIVAAVLSGGSFLAAFGWMAFIVTLSYFATAVGAFINLSLPQQAGKEIKQVVQIMFVYFGLLPDALIIILSYMNGPEGGSFVLPIALSSLCNIVLGTLFLALIPRHIDPKESTYVYVTKRTVLPVDAAEPVVIEERHLLDLRKAKKTFSRVGTSLIVWYLISSIAVALALVIFPDLFARMEEDSSLIYLLNFIPMYVIGLPFVWLLLRRLPACRPHPERLDTVSLLKALPMALCMILGGSLIGTVIQSIFTAITGIEAENALDDLVTEDQPLLVITFFVVILGPFVEELVFRKLLFERLRSYGEKTAIFVTALLFGLFHGNLAQFIYASMLGLLLGYVYARTGRLRYSYLLHAFVNFCGSVVPMFFLKYMGPDAKAWMNGETDLTPAEIINILDQGMVPFLVFTAIEYGIAIWGLVLIIRSRKHLYFEPREQELPKEIRANTVYGNGGMIVAIVMFTGLIVLTLFGLM